LIILILGEPTAHLAHFNRLILAKSVVETLVRLVGEILGSGIRTSTLGVLADGEPLESPSSISGGVATGDLSMMCSAYKLDEQLYLYG
jgi:hypothetical protein